MSEPEAVTKPRTMLFVEDEILPRMLMTDFLRSEGYAVIEAGCGDEGRDLLLAGEAIDLVVTDINMPGDTDGLVLAEIAKTIAPTRPVIVVSSHLPATVAPCADRFLPKPYLPASILEVVVSLIGPPS